MRAMFGTVLGAIAVCIGSAVGQDPAPAAAVHLVGRVVDGGRPAAGVLVHARWITHPELPGHLAVAVAGDVEREASARTADDGWFEIAVKASGPCAVFAETEDRQRRSRRHFPVLPGDFVTLALEATPMLTGQVLGPASAGHVHVTTVAFGDRASIRERYDYPLFESEIELAQPGAFSLPRWPPAPVPLYHSRSLRAWSDDRVSTDRFYLLDDQTVPKPTLSLQQPAVTAGRVLAPDGTKVAGATVWEPWETQRSMQTGADGRFVFREALQRTLIVSAKGMQSITVHGGDLGDIRLIAAKPARVRVIDDGKPVADADVVLATRLPAHVQGESDVVAPWRTRTDADGVLVVDGVTTGAAVVGYVAIDGRYRAFLQTVVTGSDLGDVTVPAARTLRGAVVDADRQPVPGVRVMMVAGAGQPSPMRVTYTDHGGRFALEEVPRWPVRIGVAAGEHGYGQIEVAPTGGDAPLTIALPAEPVVRGHVFRPDGKPAKGADVQLISVEAPEAAPFGPVYLTLHADDDGAFEIRGVPAGASWTCYGMLTVDGQGYLANRAGTFPPPDDLVVQLQSYDGRF